MRSTPFVDWPTLRVHELRPGDRIWVHSSSAWRTVRFAWVPDPASDRGLGNLYLTEDDQPYRCARDTPYATQPSPTLPRVRAADLVRGDTVWTGTHSRWVTVEYPLGDPYGRPDAVTFRNDGHEPYPTEPDRLFYLQPEEHRT